MVHPPSPAGCATPETGRPPAPAAGRAPWPSCSSCPHSCGARGARGAGGAPCGCCSRPAIIQFEIDCPYFLHNQAKLCLLSPVEIDYEYNIIS